MADREHQRNKDNDVLRMRDIVQVGSRVSWGAILAGAMVALALFFLLAALGAAIGITAYDNMERQTLETGAMVWGIIVAIVALFAGGYVTSRFTVGEGRGEAVIYGLILWGVVSVVLLHFTTAGLSMGAEMMTGVSRSETMDWRNAARESGITAWDRSADQPDNGAGTAGANDATRSASSESSTDGDAKMAAWAGFGGTLLCMIAAVVGSLVGVGPRLRLARTMIVGDADTHSSTT